MKKKRGVVCGETLYSNSRNSLFIRRKIEQLMDNAAYQDEIRKLNDTEKYKNAGDVAGYHKVLDDILTNWKQDYYKYTAR